MAGTPSAPATDGSAQTAPKPPHAAGQNRNVPGQEQQQNRRASATLERSTYILVLVGLYASASIVAWVLKCVAVFRPLGGVSYDYYSQFRDLADMDPGKWDKSPLKRDSFETLRVSRRILRFARVLQSVVAVLTVPLISAVCSQAAVVYLQRRARCVERRATLRQAMALADKSWTTPKLLLKLAFQRRSRQVYGSQFLWVSIGLMILGELSTDARNDLFLTDEKCLRYFSQFYTSSPGELRPRVDSLPHL